jgi:FkbM family methyltransferase
MRLIKAFVKKTLDKAGYAISLKDQSQLHNSGMEEGFFRMRELGISPGTIIDIGAAQGSWTTKALKFWPNARYELIEPLQENEDRLAELKSRNTNINFHLAVAGESVGETWLEVSSDLDGSGIYGQPSMNSRKVPIITVDDVVKDSADSIILKLDTHGYEVPILKGAKNALGRTSLLIIEVYGFKISPTCLLFHELSVELDKLGFRLVDIVDIMRRPNDNVFWQCDAFFLRKDHPVFENSTYA